MTQGTVTVQDLLILGGIVELDLAGAEALGYFEHEASRFLHVRELSESDVREAMREVRLALLEADVNYKVAKEFTAKVTERAIGAEVMVLGCMMPFR